MASDGTGLFSTRWPADGTPRATVLLVHGLKDHSGRYGVLARALQREGVDVHAFDLRGHGRSGGDRQWVARFDDLVDDLDQFATPRMEGASSTFAFGHSMGGAVVLRWIALRRPPLAGVVLSAPAIRPPASVSARTRQLTRVLGRIIPRARLFRLPFEDFSRSPASVAEMADDPYIDPTPAPIRTGAELLRVMAGLPGTFARFDRPVLALHGTEDRLTDPAGSEAFIAAVPSTDK
ncbi:MAG TPA: lysophospholipase, partial [Thermoplasmata archaeon]|nr:lysophospholipase [Thermoplasmata archaeon]